MMNRVALALGLATALSSPAAADTIKFIGGDFFGPSWENAAGETVSPQSGDDLVNEIPVDPSSGETVAPEFDGAPEGVSFNRVEIGSDASAGGGTPAALVVFGGELRADQVGAGNGQEREGEILVFGGQVTAREMSVGGGGSGRLAIGEFGPAAVVVTEQLTLGAANGAGAIEIASEGSLTVGGTFNSGGLILGLTQSFITENTVTQNGGAANLYRLFVAGDEQVVGSFGDGSYTINDGVARVEFGQVGYAGRGDFVQNGGEVTFGSLFMGNVGSRRGNIASAWGFGTYVLNDGLLITADSANANFNGTVIGGFGQATFTQNGGRHDVVGASPQGPPALIIGLGEAPRTLPTPGGGPVPGPNDRFGRYEMNGGLLVTAGDVILGAGAVNSLNSAGGLGFFDQTGGAVDVGGDLVIGARPPEFRDPAWVRRNAGGEGVYTKSGGDLLVRGDMVLGERGNPGQLTSRGAFGQIGGTTVVNGDIRIENNADFAIGAGTTVTAKNARIGGGAQLADLILGQPGSELILLGDLGIPRGGDLEIRNNGRVGGVGLITGSVQVANLGTIKPGLSPGRLTIDGDLTLEGGSILDLEFAGSGLGEYDQIFVTGDLFATGPISMRLTFLDSFLPSTLDFFTIFDVGGSMNFNGFDPIIEMFGAPAGMVANLGDIANGGTIGFSSVAPQPSPVPLPAGVWLLMAGLGALVGLRRKSA